MAEVVAHACAAPAGCAAPGVRLIWWRGPNGEGRTWACDEHVEEIRRERIEAGCSVIGPARRREASP